MTPRQREKQREYNRAYKERQKLKRLKQASRVIEAHTDNELVRPTTKDEQIEQLRNQVGLQADTISMQNTETRVLREELERERGHSQQIGQLIGILYSLRRG